MKPAQARTLDPRMKEHEIDDRDLTRSRPTDPASLQSADPVLCPTPFEPGWAGDTRAGFASCDALCSLQGTNGAEVPANTLQNAAV